MADGTSAIILGQTTLDAYVAEHAPNVVEQFSRELVAA